MSSRQLELPIAIDDVAQLDRLLSEPSEAVVAGMSRIEGDIILLGAGGKMGPTLAMMAKRASDSAEIPRRVIGVSRFTDAAVERRLNAENIETLRGDLLDPDFVASLPDVANVIYMAGMKFGATRNLPLAWAMNVHVPAIVCHKYARGRIVAFSTGNVYGLAPADQGGSVESDALDPQGEYAMSCVGRERIFEYSSRAYGIPMALLRLNYAVELRYGVLVDLARKVLHGDVVDLSMGYVNVIWQGDASAMALCALADATSPPLVLNIAGPEQLSVRDVCERFGQLLGKPVRFRGREEPDAFLSNGGVAFDHYGPPRIAAEQIIHWVADWLSRGGVVREKSTHFEVRDGRF